MTTSLSACLALAAGAALAAQAASNARLGALLEHPLAATCCAFLVSLAVSCVALFAASKPLPPLALAHVVPPWLWFTGGILSFLGVATFYWLIPQVGVGQVVAFGLVGQLLSATLASHKGWFHLPVQPVGAMKLAGVGCLLVGVALIEGAQQ